MKKFLLSCSAVIAFGSCQAGVDPGMFNDVGKAIEGLVSLGGASVQAADIPFQLKADFDDAGRLSGRDPDMLKRSLTRQGYDWIAGAYKEGWSLYLLTSEWREESGLSQNKILNVMVSIALLLKAYDLYYKTTTYKTLHLNAEQREAYVAQNLQLSEFDRLSLGTVKRSIKVAALGRVLTKLLHAYMGYDIHMKGTLVDRGSVMRAQGQSAEVPLNVRRSIFAFCDALNSLASILVRDPQVKWTKKMLARIQQEQAGTSAA